MHLRWAIVTSQPLTLLSGTSDGYAFSAARNVSDQASSASPGRSIARQTRRTTGPCSATARSNGGMLTQGQRPAGRSCEVLAGGAR